MGSRDNSARPSTGRGRLAAGRVSEGHVDHVERLSATLAAGHTTVCSTRPPPHCCALPMLAAPSDVALMLLCACCVAWRCSLSPFSGCRPSCLLPSCASCEVWIQAKLAPQNFTAANNGCLGCLF